MDRRNFLKTSALGVAGVLVGAGVVGNLMTSCAPKTTNAKRIGLQLWSLREGMMKDPRATLEAVARMGYAEIETADYAGGKIYGMTPAEFRALVEGLGMRVTSCHVGGGQPQSDEWWAQTLADFKAVGCKYIVIPSFALEDPAAVCEYFNRVAAMVAAHGMIFAYHNHAVEFETGVYDALLAGTSADVKFELDVHWAVKGGTDPVALIGANPGRFPVLHIKDEDIVGASGAIDFEPIFNAAYAAGMEDFYVEVEQYPLPPEVCVERSFDFLEVAPYVK